MTNLGEAHNTFGWDSSGKFATHGNFQPYGYGKWRKGDVIAALLDLDSNPPRIAFAKNGVILPAAYQAKSLGKRVRAKSPEATVSPDENGVASGQSTVSSTESSKAAKSQDSSVTPGEDTSPAANNQTEEKKQPKGRDNDEIDIDLFPHILLKNTECRVQLSAMVEFFVGGFGFLKLMPFLSISLSG